MLCICLSACDDCHGAVAMRCDGRGLPFCLVGSSCLRQLERECEARNDVDRIDASIDRPAGCSDGNGLSIIEAIHMIVEDRSVLIPLQFILLRI